MVNSSKNVIKINIKLCLCFVRNLLCCTWNLSAFQVMLSSKAISVHYCTYLVYTNVDGDGRLRASTARSHRPVTLAAARPSWDFSANFVSPATINVCGGVTYGAAILGPQPSSLKSRHGHCTEQYCQGRWRQLALNSSSSTTPLIFHP